MGNRAGYGLGLVDNECQTEARSSRVWGQTFEIRNLEIGHNSSNSKKRSQKLLVLGPPEPICTTTARVTVVS